MQRLRLWASRSIHGQSAVPPRSGFISSASLLLERIPSASCDLIRTASAAGKEKKMCPYGIMKTGWATWIVVIRSTWPGGDQGRMDNSVYPDIGRYVISAQAVEVDQTTEMYGLWRIIVGTCWRNGKTSRKVQNPLLLFLEYNDILLSCFCSRSRIKGSLSGQEMKWPWKRNVWSVSFKSMQERTMRTLSSMRFRFRLTKYFCSRKSHTSTWSTCWRIEPSGLAEWYIPSRIVWLVWV